MAEELAYCGILCGECEAYKATASGDHAALERVAAKWNKSAIEDGAKPIGPDDVLCEGCVGQVERQFRWCARCSIRACAIERDVANCAHCADYGCEKMAWLAEAAPDAKQRLDALRSSLGTS